MGKMTLYILTLMFVPGAIPIALAILITKKLRAKKYE